jgi:hypothetical protein
VDISLSLLSLKYNLSHILITLFFLQNGAIGFSQKFEKVATLPVELNETSGLEVLPNGWLLSHNDSGDEPWIYILSKDGKLIRKVYIQGIRYVDWEDVSYDADEDVLYIGDVGNNANNRRNLEVGKVTDFFMDMRDTMQAVSRVLRYENQKEFPPSADDRHFDVEAMAYYKDYLYFFSKNRTSPYDGMLYMWKYSADLSSDVAVLTDSLSIGGLMTFNWITAADISKNRLALTSSMEAWIFAFVDTVTLRGGHQKINYSNISQKESIAWLSADTLVLTDESIGAGANLYRLVLEENTLGPLSKDFQIIWKAGSFQCSSITPIQQVRIFGMDGRLAVSHFSGKKEVNLDTHKLAEGVYIVEIQLVGNAFRTKKMLYAR